MSSDKHSREAPPLAGVKKRSNGHRRLPSGFVTIQASRKPVSLSRFDATHRARYASVLGEIATPPGALKTERTSDFTPPKLRRPKTFKAGLIHTFLRLLGWLWALVAFGSGVMLDKVSASSVRLLNRWFGFRTRKDPPANGNGNGNGNETAAQARRLYKTLAALGGTFVKIGQQLSIRNDVLPDEYCVELSRLLDKVKPFPPEKAIEIIEAATHQPLYEIFSFFDPEPIGSGSVACVYKAILKQDQQPVVVKVQRPDIGPSFAADFRGLRWLYGFLNLFNLLPRIMTRELIDEFHETLMEELDFELEARHQSLFRECARKSQWRFFTAPRVYFELSGPTIIVQEFVPGDSVKDILAILESGDAEGLAALCERQIDPKIVARRLLKVNYWGIWDNFFFHADPHPSNIMVQPNNRLVFLDFGSTGLLGRERRQALQHIYDLTAKEDVEGASKVSLTLMEPLPPLDDDAILKEIQTNFRRAIVAMNSEGVPWSERTSARLWLGFFDVAREFEVPINPAVVRLIRGTMLYDTLAARLDNDIDIQAEYHKYRRAAGAEARRRLQREMKKRKKGPTVEDYLRFEELMEEGNRLIFRTVRAINDFPLNFSALGRSFQMLDLVGDLLVRIMLIWGLPVIGVFVYLRVSDLALHPNPLNFEALQAIWSNTIDLLNKVHWYLPLCVVLTLLLFLRAAPKIFAYSGKRDSRDDN